MTLSGIDIGVFSAYVVGIIGLAYWVSREKAINTVAGVELVYGLIFLGAFAAAYSLYGGLKAVAFTDIIQVVLLVGGGLYGADGAGAGKV